jgi:type IV pilus assembly protein PilE
MKRARGFTLLELMIVVAIVAILAAFALSNYSKQVRKSRRSDAKQVITALALLEEKYRSEHTTYGTVSDISGSTTSPYYTIALTASSNTATGYQFTAVPLNDQAKDDCGTLTWTMSSGSVTKLPATNCW